MKRKRGKPRRSESARRGWVTRRRREAEREAERERRSRAARKAWAERRKKEAEAKAARARAARKGWRRKKKAARVRKREKEVVEHVALGAVSLSRAKVSWFGYREGAPDIDAKLSALRHGGLFRCYVDFGLFPPKNLDPANYLEITSEEPPSEDLNVWWRIFYDTGRAALEAAKGVTGESESIWCLGIDFIPEGGE